MANPPNGGGSGPSDEDIRNAEELNGVYSEMRNTLRGVESEFKSLIRVQADMLEEWDSSQAKIVKSIGSDLNKEIKESVKLTKILADAEKGVGKSLTSQIKVQEQIKAVEGRRRLIQDLLLEAESEGLILNQAIIDQQAVLLEQLNKQDDALQKQLNKLVKFDRLLGGIGGVLKGLSKIPIIGQFIKAEEVLAKMKKTAEEGGSKLKVFADGASALFKGIGTTLLGLIIPALKFVVDAVIQFDQKAFDIAKNLGTSVSEGERLQKNFQQIANSSGNAALMSKDVAKSFTEISNTLGFLVPSSGAFAESAALIQKRIGASAEDMAVLARQSALNGQTLEQTYATLSASRVIEGVRNKLALTNKQILDGIVKTSAAIVINFKGSTEALANAVIRATKLGTTLNDVNKQGESLLDFESSIQKEFELQVLTGRNINLTKARELALLGDTAGLMEELNRQQVTYDSFTKENVIQRKAEADAIGLSVDELSKKLLAQKQANALGAEEGQSLQERYNDLMKTAEGQKRIKEELTLQEQADLRRASMQERFQAAVEKLKDTLGSMLGGDGPVGKMINAFASFVGDTKKMIQLGNTLKNVFTFIYDTMKHLPQILGAAVEAMKILASLTAVQAAAAVTAGSAYMGPLAIGAGIAAYGALTYLMGGFGLGKMGSVLTEGPTQGAMTQPPTNYSTQSQSENSANESAKTPAINLHANIQVGTEGWGQQTIKSLRQTHATSLH